MHHSLKAAINVLGLDGQLPSLVEADRVSEERIAKARNVLESHSTPGFDVVGFGSLARREMTEQSDFDFLVLASRLPDDDPGLPGLLLERARGLRKEWAFDDGKEPAKEEGTSGVFGRVVGAFDLVDRIGLQEDTNHSLTRRILLLEESVSLMNEDAYAEVIRATLHRYLTIVDAEPMKVPRFLLNDVIRYWRTITVDFQAKKLGGSSQLRHLKLIVPRKILYAGTVMSLLVCGLDGAHKAEVDELREQFSRSPLSRLMSISTFGDEAVNAHLRTVLKVFEMYLERSGDSDWRTEVEEPDSSAFAEMVSSSKELQDALERIFFDWQMIAQRSRHYLAI